MLSVPGPLAVRRSFVLAGVFFLLVCLCALQLPRLSLTMAGSPAVPAPPTAPAHQSLDGFTPSAGLAAAMARVGVFAHPSYAFVPSPAGYVTHLASGLPATLGANGSFAVRTTTGAAFSLTPNALARAGRAATALTAGASAVTAGRLVQHLGAVTMVSANSARGLESSYLLARRPAGAGSTFSLAFTPSAGAVTTLVTSHEARFTFGPHTSLTYGGLRVTDATGRTLPSWFATSGGQLRMMVRDQGARYPLRIDPTWGGGTDFSSGGGSVSTSDNGSVVLVGQPFDDDPTGAAPAAGEAFLFMQNSFGEWEASYLYAPTAEPSDPGYFQDSDSYFGAAVAVSADGETAVITEPGYQVPVAFFFTLGVTTNAATATFAGYLQAQPSTNVTPEGFGQSAAIYHDGPDETTEVFVGAPGSAAKGGNQGAVYEYTDPTLATYGDGNDNYMPNVNSVALYDGTDSGATGGIKDLGASLTIAPDSRVIAGAPLSGSTNTDAGAVVQWIWGGWPQDGQPNGPTDDGGSAATTVFGLNAGDELGYSVATNPTATTVAAGEPYADTPTSVNEIASGAVEILNLSGSAGDATRHGPDTGSCLASVVGPVTAAVANEGYGSSVAVSDDGTTVLVGAPNTGYRLGVDSPPTDAIPEYAYFEYSAGAAWGCNTPGNLTYTEQAVAGPTQFYDNQTFGTYFGQSVAMAGNESYAYVGAPMDSIAAEESGFEGQGDVYQYIGPPPLSKPTVTGTPPPGTVGASYDFAVSVGGNPSPTVSIGGALPPGLTASDGHVVVSGIPTATGSYPVTFTASSSQGTATDPVTFVIHATPPTVTKVVPAQGTPAGGTAVVITGTGFSPATAVTFGTKAATFTVASATTIDATAPKGSGTAEVVVTDTPGGPSATGTKTVFTYTAADVKVTSASLAAGTEGTAYSAQLTASGTSGTSTWKATGLPAGLHCSSSGALSGKPTASGTFHVLVRVTSGSSNDTKTLTLTVAS